MELAHVERRALKPCEGERDIGLKELVGNVREDEQRDTEHEHPKECLVLERADTLFDLPPDVTGVFARGFFHKEQDPERSSA